MTLWSPEENVQHTELLPHTAYAVPINLTHLSGTGKVIATITAKNGAGMSPPASVVIPLRTTGVWKVLEEVLHLSVFLQTPAIPDHTIQ